VIVLDANILLYAWDSTAKLHAQARAWIESSFSSGSHVGIPWQSAGAFLRIVTNTRFPGDRYTIEEAVAIVETWCEQPNVHLLVPGDRHWDSLRRTLLEGQCSGPLVTDAQLAALTIEHGGTLYTTDRDFARFPGLRWTNPLATQ
jgi:toxin-antitoxin system PIN domain toxin